MGLELTTDRHQPTTSQTRYPLRHDALITESNAWNNAYKMQHVFNEHVFFCSVVYFVTCEVRGLNTADAYLCNSETFSYNLIVKSHQL